MSGNDDAVLTTGARRILDTASVLFYERGINAVGVDTIAVESGVTKRTLYDRFGSKDTLVTAYLQQRHAAWWGRWDERLANAQPPRALTAFDAYADDAHPTGRGCAFLNAAAELSAGHPGLAVIRDHKERVRSRVEALIAEDAGLADPARTAEHVFLLLEGAITHQGIDGDGARLRAARSFAEELLVTGAR